MRASWQTAYVGVITTIRSAASYEANDKGATFMSMALEAELRVERYRASGAQYPLDYGSDAAAA
jgi:hypothetical protein